MVAVVLHLDSHLERYASSIVPIGAAWAVSFAFEYFFIKPQNCTLYLTTKRLCIVPHLPGEMQTIPLGRVDFSLSSKRNYGEISAQHGMTKQELFRILFKPLEGGIEDVFCYIAEAKHLSEGLA